MHRVAALLLLAACQPTISEPDQVAPRTAAGSHDDPIDSNDGPIDVDGDGVFSDEDCDDDDASVYPNAPERCDAVDHDCDGRAFTPDDCPCPRIVAFDDVFLSGCAEAATWERARDLCALYDMRLVVPDNAFINEHVRALADDLRRGPTWVGLSDQRVEGDFRTVSGEPLVWENWERFEPNDAGAGEDCVQLYPWNGRWNDAGCTLQASFVCEPDDT